MIPRLGKKEKSASGAQPPSPEARRILVIKLGALGDFIQALAPAKVIRDYHVGARITLLTTEPFEAFAKACPYFDVIETDGRPKERTQIVQMLQRVRQQKYDMVYDLQTSTRSSGYFMGLKPWPPLWSGIAAGCSHPHANPNRETMHSLDRLADQLYYAGIAPAYDIGAAPLPDVSWVRSALRDPPRLQPEYFGIRRPYGLIVPGASAHRPEKRWPAEAFGALAKRIIDQGVTPVIIGHNDEKEAAGEIARIEPRVKNLVSRTDLFQVATLAEQAAFAVGNDTGPMHIAAAAGAACVVLFSSESNPAKTAPRSVRGAMTVMAENLADLPAPQVDQAIRNMGGYASLVGA
jgi:ADP-heptose:LPS heptosyltransferase